MLKIKKSPCPVMFIGGLIYEFHCFVIVLTMSDGLGILPPFVSLSVVQEARMNPTALYTCSYFACGVFTELWVKSHLKYNHLLLVTKPLTVSYALILSLSITKNFYSHLQKTRRDFFFVPMIKLHPWHSLKVLPCFSGVWYLDG